MAEKKIEREWILHSDLDKLVDEYDPQYVILISARNDGKSYAVKYRALKRAIEKGEKFTYLRRYEIDLKRADPAYYWNDFYKADNNVVMELTKGQYNCIIAKNRAEFWLANRHGKKVEEGELIGYIHALSVASSYKSLQFPDVGSIIYEEFVSDRYLYNEPRKMLNYVSTVLRGENKIVWMIGNTISRISPYYREFELTHFNKMQPGDVDTYDEHYTLEDGTETTSRIIVHIPDIKKKGNGIKSMFFGSAAHMIAGQQWDVEEQPHLMDKRSEYHTMYEMVFDYDQNACYLMTLLQSHKDPGRILWYVEPKTTELQERTRIVCPRLNEKAGPLYTNRFTAISERERKAFRLLDYGRIAYSDNLTGTEFKRALAMSRTPDNSRE